MPTKIDWSTMTLDQLEQYAAGLKKTGKRPPAGFTKALNAARQAAADAESAVAAQDAACEPEPASSTDEVQTPGQPDAEAAVDADAEARRTAFTTRIAQLIGSGLTEAQALEALTGEYPDEASEYTAMMPQVTPEELAQLRPPVADPQPADDTETDAAKSSNEETKDDTAIQPHAVVDVDARPVTYYWGRATITIPNLDGDGDTTETITCSCRYGHERTDLALAHARKIAAERGARLA